MIICVLVAPKISEHSYSDRLIVKAASTTAIEVPFTAHPQPTATWAYKGGAMADKRRFQSECLKGLATLNMKKIKPTEKG